MITPQDLAPGTGVTGYTARITSPCLNTCAVPSSSACCNALAASPSTWVRFLPIVLASSLLAASKPVLEAINICPAPPPSSRWEAVAEACNESRARSTPITASTLPSTINGTAMVVISTCLLSTSSW
ncbi:hypothetical protein D3C81_1930700 [compost metagenome]